MARLTEPKFVGIINQLGYKGVKLLSSNHVSVARIPFNSEEELCYMDVIKEDFNKLLTYPIERGCIKWTVTLNNEIVIQARH